MKITDYGLEDHGLEIQYHKTSVEIFGGESQRGIY